MSPISLYTSTVIRRDVSFVRAPIADVYFIAFGSDEIKRIRTDGTGLETVAIQESNGWEDRLAFIGTSGESTWDLWLVGREAGSSRRSGKLVLSNLPAARIDADGSFDTIGQQHKGFSWWSGGRAHDLRDPTARPWEAWCGTWAGEGLTIWSEETQARTRIALETPFVQWHCRCPTVLPSGQILFQLGRDLVLYDPESRELGFLTAGSGPAVLVP